MCAFTSEDEDRILGALVLRVGEICADYEMVSHIKLPRRVFDPPSPIFLISPTAVPSCLIPTVQHFPIGLDAIVLDLDLQEKSKEFQCSDVNL